MQQLLSNPDVAELQAEISKKNNQKANSWLTILNHNQHAWFNATISGVIGSFVIDMNTFSQNDPENPFYIIAMSSVLEDSRLNDIRVRGVEKLKPLFKAGWDTGDLDVMLVSQCKAILEEVLGEMNTFNRTPEVFHYEIGEHTDYQFVTPEGLTDLEVKQKD